MAHEATPNTYLAQLQSGHLTPDQIAKQIDAIKRDRQGGGGTEADRNNALSMQEALTSYQSTVTPAGVAGAPAPTVNQPGVSGGVPQPTAQPTVAPPPIALPPPPTNQPVGSTGQPVQSSAQPTISRPNYSGTLPDTQFNLPERPAESGPEAAAARTTGRLEDINELSQDLLLNRSREFYPGQTYANLNPTIQTGLESQLNFAGGAGTEQANLAQQGLQTGFGQVTGSDVAQTGAALQPQLIDTIRQMQSGNVDASRFQPVIEAAANQARQALDLNILPQQRASAIDAGQYGGSRSQIAEGVATGLQGQRIADLAGTLGYQAYSDAQNRMGQGADLAAGLLTKGGELGADYLKTSFTGLPFASTAGQLPGQIQTSVGGVEQGQTQLGINEDIARFNYKQDEPYAALQTYQDFITGNRPEYAPRAAGQDNSKLAGVIGGAGAGGSLFPAIAGATPWGALAGAALGGILS